MDSIWHRIRDLPLVAPLLVVALGTSVGRLSIRRVGLGPAGGTLFVALAVGASGVFAVDGAHSNLVSLKALGTFGFALFIYSVGFDAAPHLRTQIRSRRGLAFVTIGSLVSIVGVGVMVALAAVLDLSPSAAAGILAGALTSPPTFAAASEVADDPATLSIAFALTYPIGLVALVILIQTVPRLTRQDLGRDALSEEELAAREQGATRAEGGSPEFTRAFEVRSEEVIGRPLRELGLTRRTGCVISRIHRAPLGGADGDSGTDEVLIPSGDTQLLPGDHVVVTGRVDELKAFEALVGEEAFDLELQAPRLPSRRVLVRSRQVSGQALRDLRIIDRFHCVVTRIERGTLWIEPGPDVVLRRGDVIEVVGQRADLQRFTAEVGRFEPPGHETDIAVYAGGILLGLALGSISIDVGAFHITLGFAGGLLLVGVLMGLRRQLGPVRTHVPREARQLVRDLGISLFVAAAGLEAGPHVGAALADAPGAWLVAATLVHVVAVVVPLLVARLWRLRPLDAWGSVCGGMTSSAALHTVRRAADSTDVAASYAAAYAVASILATLAGPGIIVLLSR